MRVSRAILVFFSVVSMIAMVYVAGIMVGVSAGTTISGLIINILIVLCGPSALGLGCILGRRSPRLSRTAVAVGVLTITVLLGYLFWGVNQNEPGIAHASPLIANCILCISGLLVISSGVKFCISL